MEFFTPSYKVPYIIYQKFDAIWILTYAGQDSLLYQLLDQLYKLGIRKDFIYVHENVKTGCDHQLLAQSKNVDKSAVSAALPGIDKDKYGYTRLFANNMKDVNITKGHLEIFEKSMLLGQDKILVLENDVLLLKNLSLLETYLKNVPNDFDHINFYTYGFDFIYEINQPGFDDLTKVQDPDRNAYYIDDSARTDVLTYSNIMYAVSNNAKLRCNDIMELNIGCPLADVFPYIWKKYLGDHGLRCYRPTVPLALVTDAHNSQSTKDLDTWWYNTVFNKFMPEQYHIDIKDYVGLQFNNGQTI